jgi:hypothetical protein
MDRAEKRQCGMSDSPDLSGLFTRAENAQYDFLEADLALCHTFADLVKTEFEMGDHQGVQRAFSTAEAGYATISRLRSCLADPAHREEIEEGLEKLRSRLDELKPMVNAAPVSS